jgi:hypothetical protein
MGYRQDSGLVCYMAYASSLRILITTHWARGASFQRVSPKSRRPGFGKQDACPTLRTVALAEDSAAGNEANAIRQTLKPRCIRDVTSMSALGRGGKQ